MTEHIREEYALPPGVRPSDSLAHRLVMAAQNASQDCGCGPNESAIVAAVLRELDEDGWILQHCLSNGGSKNLRVLANEITISKALEGP